MKFIDKFKNQILAIIFFSVYIYLDKPWWHHDEGVNKRVNKITGEIQTTDGEGWKNYKKKYRKTGLGF